MSSSPSLTIVICGQTGTGKSSLAVALAERYHGEVVSADSRQVYRYLDNASGKISPVEMQGIPHHLLGHVDLLHDYTVAEYRTDAEKAIADIHAKGKVAIVCGGTGQYIQALTTPISFPSVPPNPLLRAQLESKSAPQLFMLLQERDPVRAESIDKHNKARLVRALEIIESLGTVPPLRTPPPTPVDTQSLTTQLLLIGVRMEKDELVERIRTRIGDSLENMISEIDQLHTIHHIPWDRIRRLGLWPNLIAQYIQENLSRDELIVKMNTKTWQYAKRQRTWFAKDTRIQWFHPTNERDSIFSMIQSFLEKIIR